MTDAERWKVINDVPAGDILAAMKAIGDMMKAGATREEVDAMRKAMVMAWDKPAAGPSSPSLLDPGEQKT